MPRSSEYVLAKSYQKWQPNTEAFWKKPGTRPKKAAEEKKGTTKTKRPPNERQREAVGPAKTRKAIGPGPDKGKGGAAGGEGAPVGGYRTVRQERQRAKDVVPRGGKKGDVEWGTPRMGQNPTQWAHAERIRPTAIEGRRAIGAAPERRPHYGPDRTPLTGNRQFTPIGPGHEPVTAADKRAANLAALVRDTPKQTPLSGGRERNARGMSIITGEIVPERTTTKEIKAVGPRSSDANTAPLAPVRADTPQEPRLPSRGGDTGHIPLSPYAHDVTAPIAKIGRQFPQSPRLALPAGQRALGSSPHTPQPGIALTQHAEPFGQMSLFQEKREGNLAIAKTSRTDRQTTVPPSLAAGRQMELFSPARFKAS